LTWLEESYYWHRLTPAEAAEIGLKKPQSFGHGIGLAIGLFAMQMGSSFVSVFLFGPKAEIV
jgi:hypothetical protein